MEKKKLAEVGIAILIAITFISSYASMSNYLPKSSQKTTTVPQTAYGQGLVTVALSAYGSPASIIINCSNSTVSNATITSLSNIFNNLENNNSISTFYSSGTSFQVASGNMSTYNVYNYLNRNMPAAQFGCINATAPAYLRLPRLVNFTVSTQSVPIYLTETNQNVTINLPMSNPIGTKLRAKISGLVTSNGTLYGSIGITLLH